VPGQAWPSTSWTMWRIAICQNDSAVLEMGDELLKKIARELVESVRRNAPSTGVRRNRCALGCVQQFVACSRATATRGTSSPRR
jgi:hypothetical protein